MRNGRTGNGAQRADAVAAARALSARSVHDDFFCWKFRVWYNLEDCVFRHVHRTTRECAECDQGRGNVRLVRNVPDPPRWVRLLSVDDFDGAPRVDGERP